MYSIDSKVRKLARNEEASKIIAEYSPGFLTDPRMKAVQGLSFRKLASFGESGLTPEILEEIDAKLKALPDDEDD